MNEKQEVLRHFLAVLAYRTQKALHSAPEHFGSFRAGPEVRTPRELLYHMSSLLHHTLAAMGGMRPDPLDPGPDLEGEAEQFYTLLGQLSRLLADSLLQEDRLAERLLQGPLADAMTHVGQLALLRHLAGAPVPWEDFFRAPIHPKNVDAGQPFFKP